MMNSKNRLIGDEIAHKIKIIRGKKVLLSYDLAEIYQVEHKRFNEQVKRNMDRFPENYMFQLSEKENESLRSHFATLKKGQHQKYPPYAFTEHGVLMLATVLKGNIAIQVSMMIVDTFIRLNEMVKLEDLIFQKINELEIKVESNEKNVNSLIDYLNAFIEIGPKGKRKIGFKLDDES